MDFLTWFQCAHDGADVFEELVATLRSIEHGSCVNCEIDVRLVRTAD